MTESDEARHLLYKNETIEDLQRTGFRLIQPAAGFRFGEDSVLLAALAAEICQQRRPVQVADLAAGCGVVGILLAARLPLCKIVAVELDPHRTDCLRRNIELNQLQERMSAVQADIRILGAEGETASRWPLSLKPSSCDLVVTNPPYRIPTGRNILKWQEQTPEEKSRLMATEEWALDLEQLTRGAARLLKPGGRLLMIHRPQRLPDLISCLRAVRLEPVSLQVLESLPGKAPSRIIVTARYLGKPGGFRWLEPLWVCDSPGRYSVRAAELYGHEPAMAPEVLMRAVKTVSIDWETAEKAETSGGI